MKFNIPGGFSSFSKEQLAVLRRLDTPRKVQDFIDYELAYNGEQGTCFSPLTVLKRRKAHCAEGALLAAAAFLFHGRPALLLDLRANSRDDDHVIAPFLENGRWGAAAQSHFCGLRYREPVYRTSAELARSYFEFYYNNRGEKTLREFSVPLDASRLAPEWLYSEKNVFFVSRALDAVKHYGVLGRYTETNLRKADSRLFEAEVLGGPKAPLSKRRARPYAKLRLPRELF
ncbi:MAG: hypothetical protein A3J79_07860 [Elusimicrobia bacterium RIFOXYB2_FULL_62_6]|nr:MAG: hypothetical protein A3J79_07860 [Elusimicrobia bacterium RIFOXYB2_FULL_62_6]